MNKNEIYTVDIQDMNNLGMGVCRIDGIVTFVNGAVLGDKAEIRIIKCLKGYSVARTERIISPSSMRVDGGACQRTSSCGGCVYGLIKYEHELEIKRNQVLFEMKKAGLDMDVAPVYSTGRISRYRNKAQYPVSQDKNGDLIAGFYARNTHRVVSCDDCLLEPEIFSSILKSVLIKLQRVGVTAYNEETGKGLLRHIYMRLGEKTQELLLCFVINGDSIPQEKSVSRAIAEEFPEIKSIFVNINKERTNVINGKKYRLIYGKETINDILCGNTVSISPDSFYQVNRDCAEKLYEKGIELLELKEDETLLDLYCGAGTITLAAARMTGVRKLFGIEIVPAAIENAKRNASVNGFSDVEFICADAGDIESIMKGRDTSLDAVILDPPRKGCSEDTLRYLVKASPKKISYISCSPDTLARDLAFLMKNGYSAHTVYPFDMFPRTGHVESLVCLKRTFNN